MEGDVAIVALIARTAASAAAAAGATPAHIGDIVEQAVRSHAVQRQPGPEPICRVPAYLPSARTRPHGTVRHDMVYANQVREARLGMLSQETMDAAKHRKAEWMSARRSMAGEEPWKPSLNASRGSCGKGHDWQAASVSGKATNEGDFGASAFASTHSQPHLKRVEEWQPAVGLLIGEADTISHSAAISA